MLYEKIPSKSKQISFIFFMYIHNLQATLMFANVQLTPFNNVVTNWDSKVNLMRRYTSNNSNFSTITIIFTLKVICGFFFSYKKNISTGIYTQQWILDRNI